MKQILTLFGFIYITLMAFPSERSKPKSKSIQVKCDQLINGQCFVNCKQPRGGQHVQ